MLDELWQSVFDHIEGRGGGAPALIERVRRDVTAGVDDPKVRGQLETFMAEVPERYLLANSLERIRAHAQVVQARSEPLAFGASESGVGQGRLELVIACDDRPGLLADLTAALAASRFSVDSAQLYTRTRDDKPAEAFDIFNVSHSNMSSPQLMQPELERLRANIEQVLSGQLPASELLARRARPPSWARPGPRIKTEIHVDNASSPRYTIVDVYTRDRADLLHVIARTLHEKGLTIALAKVNTEGHRVADVFYVQTHAGAKLGGSGQLADLSTALRDVIRGLD
jgi:[protein-PII] uridylyltransferase